MTTDEKSQFVKEIESRLDALFGEDNREAKKPDPGIEKSNASQEILLNGDSSEREPSGRNVFDSRFSEPPLDKDDFEVAGGGSKKPSFTDFIMAAEKKAESPDPKDSAMKEDRSMEDKVIVLTDEFSDIKSILHSPLKDLKTSVLSLEWEITQPMLQNFDDQIRHLEEIFSEDKIALSYLRILRFLGRYIQIKGNKSHPCAITFLISTYNNLETITLSVKMAEDRKWDMLLADVDDYKKFVRKLNLLEEDEVSPESQRLGAVIREIPEIEPPLIVRDSPTVRNAPSPTEIAMQPHEAFALALEEIKKTISAEFSAIRAELKMWRDMK